MPDNPSKLQNIQPPTQPSDGFAPGIVKPDGLTGGEIDGGPYEEKSGTKPCWRWSAWNNQNCMALIYAMYPFLCGRRRAKIAAMIDMWVSLGRERGAQSELQLAA